MLHSKKKTIRKKFDKKTEQKDTFNHNILDKPMKSVTKGTGTVSHVVTVMVPGHSRKQAP